VGDIKLIFKETEREGLEWTYRDQDRKKRRALINAVMEIKKFIKFVEFINWPSY
jgi:hypothetical protein